MENLFTTREVAELLSSDEWRVRRLFEDGNLPEPPRFAGKRAIPNTMIPAIVDALRNRGWLPKPRAPHSDDNGPGELRNGAAEVS